MKHTFPGGITATSNDGTGDLFLAGMMRQRDLEDVPTPQEREIMVLRERLRHATLIIGALVLEAGGTVTLSEHRLADAYGKDLIQYRDESRMLYKLSVR